MHGGRAAVSNPLTSGVPEMKTPHIAVLGGGITGVTTAYALSLRGFEVTLYERHRYAAMETSFANGGQLSASNAEVWNLPACSVTHSRHKFSNTGPMNWLSSSATTRAVGAVYPASRVEKWGATNRNQKVRNGSRRR